MLFIGGNTGNVSFRQKLVADNAVNQARYGNSVSVSDGRLLVGAPTEDAVSVTTSSFTLVCCNY